MCLALSRMPDILSERPLHVFLLKCNCRLVEKIIHSHCLFDCSTQPSTLLLFNKKNLWFSFIFLFTTISMKIVKSHYVLFLRSELLHFPLLSFLMNNFILLCHRSRCLITTVLSSAIYPGFLQVLRRRPTRKYRLPSRSFGHLHFTSRLGTQRNVSPRF